MGIRKKLLKDRLQVGTVALICDEFPDCLVAFERWHGFTGPSVHFYERALARRHAIPFEALATDERFLDAAYAALTSWGMHRMGPGGAKLEEFDSFSATVRRFVEETSTVSELTILDSTADDLERCAEHLARLFDKPGVSTSATPSIVGKSKLLHFMLPELVPPIDRFYTLRAFFGSSNPPSGYPTSEVFRVSFAACMVIASRARATIRAAVRDRRYLCTSGAKVIDNAVVGFVRLKRPDGLRSTASATRSIPSSR